MFAVKENPPCRHIANIQASYQLQNKDHSLNFVMQADNKYRVRQVVAELGLFDLDLEYPTILLWPTSHGKSSHLCQPNLCPRPPATPCTAPGGEIQQQKSQEGYTLCIPWECKNLARNKTVTHKLAVLGIIISYHRNNVPIEDILVVKVPFSDIYLAGRWKIMRSAWENGSNFWGFGICTYFCSKNPDSCARSLWSDHPILKSSWLHRQKCYCRSR